MSSGALQVDKVGIHVRMYHFLIGLNDKPSSRKTRAETCGTQLNLKEINQ